MHRNPCIKLMPARQNDENVRKAGAAVPHLQVDTQAVAYAQSREDAGLAGENSDAQARGPLLANRGLRRSPSNGRLLSKEEIDAATNAFFQRVQADEGKGQKFDATKLGKKKSLRSLRPNLFAQAQAQPITPALPDNAAAVAASYDSWHHQKRLGRLQLSVELTQSRPDGRARAHHWLSLVQLDADAPDTAARVRANKVRQLLVNNQRPGGLNSTHPQSATLPAFKFPANTVLNDRLVRKGYMRPSMYIREMFGTMGYLMVTSSLAQGGFGKFRMAMDLSGKRYAVKELRTAESSAYAKGQQSSNKVKTMVTPAEEIDKEIDAMLTYASGVQFFDEMMWRGKLYVFMEVMKGDAMNLIFSMRERWWECSLFLAVTDVSKQLHTLHTEHRAVHRDFKWANVLVGQEGHFHLSDFGLTERLDERGEYRTDLLMGSYFAPESAVPENGKYVFLPASDIFCLGIAIGCQLLPEVATPFTPRLNQDGSVGLEGDPRGFRHFSQFWRKLLDETGHVDMDKLTSAGPFGSYFSQMAEASRSLTFRALNFMLAPNPKDRSTAQMLAEGFAAELEESGMEEPMRAQVAATPDDLPIAEASLALGAYWAARGRLHRREGRK